jgi:hypothetical protein
MCEENAKIKILGLEKTILELRLKLKEWQNESRQTTNVERVYYRRLDCMIGLA